MNAASFWTLNNQQVKPEMEINLNENRLAELERLANAATSGPWIACGPSFGASSPKYLNEVVVDNPEDDENDGIEVCRPPVGLEDAVSADMEFIGAANPAVVLELVRRLRNAEKTARMMREALQTIAVMQDLPYYKVCPNETAKDAHLIAFGALAEQLKGRES